MSKQQNNSSNKKMYYENTNKYQQQTQRETSSSNDRLYQYQYPPQESQYVYSPIRETETILEPQRMDRIEYQYTQQPRRLPPPTVYRQPLQDHHYNSRQSPPPQENYQSGFRSSSRQSPRYEYVHSNNPHFTGHQGFRSQTIRQPTFYEDREQYQPLSSTPRRYVISTPRENTNAPNFNYEIDSYYHSRQQQQLSPHDYDEHRQLSNMQGYRGISTNKNFKSRNPPLNKIQNNKSRFPSNKSNLKQVQPNENIQNKKSRNNKNRKRRNNNNNKNNDDKYSIRNNNNNSLDSDGPPPSVSINNHNQHKNKKAQKLDPIELISVDEISPESFKIQWLPNEKNKKLNIKLRYVLEIINKTESDKQKKCDRYLIRVAQDYYSFTYNKKCEESKKQTFDVKIRVITNYDSNNPNNNDQNGNISFMQSDWSKSIEIKKPDVNTYRLNKQKEDDIKFNDKGKEYSDDDNNNNNNNVDFPSFHNNNKGKGGFRGVNNEMMFLKNGNNNNSLMQQFDTKEQKNEKNINDNKNNDDNSNIPQRELNKDGEYVLKTALKSSLSDVNSSSHRNDMSNPHNNNPLKLYKIGPDGYPMRNIVTRISYPILIRNNIKGNNNNNNDEMNINEKTQNKLKFQEKIYKLFKNDKIQKDFGKHNKDIEIKTLVGTKGNCLQVKLNYETLEFQTKCHQIYLTNQNEMYNKLKLHNNDEILLRKCAPFSILGKLASVKAHYPIKFYIENKNNKLTINNLRQNLIKNLEYLEDLSQWNYGNLSQIWIDTKRNDNKKWCVFINFANPKAQEILFKQKTLSICGQSVKLEKRDRYPIDKSRIKNLYIQQNPQLITSDDINDLNDDNKNESDPKLLPNSSDNDDDEEDDNNKLKKINEEKKSKEQIQNEDEEEGLQKDNTTQINDKHTNDKNNDKNNDEEKNKDKKQEKNENIEKKPFSQWNAQEIIDYVKNRKDKKEDEKGITQFINVLTKFKMNGGIVSHLDHTTLKSIFSISALIPRKHVLKLIKSIKSEYPEKI